MLPFAGAAGRPGWPCDIRYFVHPPGADSFRSCGKNRKKGTSKGRAFTKPPFPLKSYPPKPGLPLWPHGSRARARPLAVPRRAAGGNKLRCRGRVFGMTDFHLFRERYKVLNVACQLRSTNFSRKSSGVLKYRRAKKVPVILDY